MIYYFFIIFINVIAIIFFYNNQTLKLRNTKAYLYVCFFILFLISSFRSLDVGIDTSQYYNHFNIISNTSIFDIISRYRFASMEIGYNLLCKFCFLIIPNYFFLQLVVSAINCFGMMHFIRFNVSNVYIGLISYLGLGVFFYSMNLSRQMIAVTFVALSWDYLRQNKLIKSFLLLILASLFHVTAIIFILVYVIYILKDYEGFYKVAIVFIILVIINYEYVLELAQLLFPVFKNYYTNQKTIQSAGMIKIIWALIFFLSIINIFNHKIDSNLKIISLFSLVFLACNIIGLKFNYFERLGLYFIPFVIPLLDLSKKRFKKRHLKKIYIVCICLFFSLMFIARGSTDQYQYDVYFINIIHK